jgi:predicted small metal-binding protein
MRRSRSIGTPQTCSRSSYSLALLHSLLAAKRAYIILPLYESWKKWECMRLSLTCKDLFPKSACPYVARSDTSDELLTDIRRHGRTAHNYTDEQINRACGEYLSSGNSY